MVNTLTSCVVIPPGLVAKSSKQAGGTSGIVHVPEKSLRDRPHDICSKIWKKG